MEAFLPIFTFFNYRKMKKNFSILIVFLMVYNSPLFSNGITIQKVGLTDTNRIAKTATVRFSIAWENSWRDSINWDAAWIFIKFREPKDSIWHYRHLTMSNTGNNAGTGTASMKFAFPDDNKGVFYYRQSIGSGKVQMDSIKLLWNYGADSVKAIDSVEIKVFATEMVYVPTGSFCIGDGNGTNRSQNSFQLKNAPNNFVTITDKWSPLVNTFVSNSYYGNDDATLYNDGIRISGLGGLDITGDKVAEYPDFPTGYRSFYCMKYPVTQGQYADFLNTLSLRDTTAWNYYMYDTLRLRKVNIKYKFALQNLDPFYYGMPVDPQRHTVILDSNEVKYTVTRPDRAFGKGNAMNNNYLSFSDWSALRPMSELEYEKACRGPLPPSYKSYNYYYNYNNTSDTTYSWGGLMYERAWGNDTTLPVWNYNSKNTSTISFSGLENGTEGLKDYNIYKRYFDITSSVPGGDGGSGPYRVGIFANDTSSRISSGASYYGIMDMSKNVYQQVVSIGNSYSRSLSYKKHGNGTLTFSGSSDNNEFFSSSNGSYIYKQNSVSDRSNNYGTYQGFRSVRSAPSDN